MKVITGGAGFIGSCLVKKFNDNGIDDILIVDNLGSSDKWKNLLGKRFVSFLNKDEFIQMIQEPDFIESFDQIIHLGACTDTTCRDTDYLISNNYQYSQGLAMLAMMNDIPMIYASSAATYGMGELGYSEDEIINLRPLNGYGFSKQLFDSWLVQTGMDHKLTGLKFFNVFGPNEYHKDKMSSMIYKAYNQIKQTGKVKLFKSHRDDYKDGEQLRDFIYVKDVVDAIWNIYKKPKVKGIFNLGTGKARSWNDLMTAVFKAMDKPINIEYIDMPEELRSQYQYYTEANMKKLKATKCVKAFSSLEDSVEDYVKNYLEKENQYL